MGGLNINPLSAKPRASSSIRELPLADKRQVIAHSVKKDRLWSANARIISQHMDTAVSWGRGKIAKDKVISSEWGFVKGPSNQK